MQARRPVLAGLALVSLAGCQSYYPYGYAGTGPYPTPPPGSFSPPASSTYAPPQSSLPPGYRQGPATYGPPIQRGPMQTYIPPNQTYAPAGAAAGAAAGSLPRPTNRPGVTTYPTSVSSSPAQVGEKPVPTPVEPRAIPDGVGGGVLDEDADEIKGSNRDSGAGAGSALKRSGGGFPSDAEDSLEMAGADDFPPPRSPIRRTSGVAESSRRGRKSPFSKDAGYRRLSGVVSQDAQTGDWQLKYDPDGADQYGGVLTLAHDEMLDNLADGDAIVVHGRIDQNDSDRYGKPRYRPLPDRLKWLVDPDER